MGEGWSFGIGILTWWDAFLGECCEEWSFGVAILTADVLLCGVLVPMDIADGDFPSDDDNGMVPPAIPRHDTGGTRCPEAGEVRCPEAGMDNIGEVRCPEVASCPEAGIEAAA